MKKMFYVLAISLLTMTQVFAAQPTTNPTIPTTSTSYDITKIDKNVYCATGEITDTSVNILAIDENAKYFVVSIDGVGIKIVTPNEYGWAIADFQDLTKGKEYKCYTISYRDGGKAYSEMNTFVAGEKQIELKK